MFLSVNAHLVNIVLNITVPSLRSLEMRRDVVINLTDLTGSVLIPTVCLLMDFSGAVFKANQASTVLIDGGLNVTSTLRNVAYVALDSA